MKKNDFSDKHLSEENPIFGRKNRDVGIERICEIDGNLFMYDECVLKEGGENWPPVKKNKVYIGEGKIWSINGVLQSKTAPIYGFYQWSPE